MESKFNFNERVKVISTNSKLSMIKNTFGTVNGKSLGDDGTFGYSVSLDINGETWCFEEYELESTGQFVSPGFDKTGESIKVIVNPDGTGEIKDNNE